MAFNFDTKFPPRWGAERRAFAPHRTSPTTVAYRSEEHTSELQSRLHLVCRLLLEKKNASVHDREDLPRVRDRNPRRPDRQGELLLPGGQRPAPHGPELHARSRLRFDRAHVASRDA